MPVWIVLILSHLSAAILGGIVSITLALFAAQRFRTKTAAAEEARELGKRYPE